MNTRHLILRTASQARIEQFEGREHLVVPVVALVEGVIHAVNADEPEFVPADLISASAASFEGKPLVVRHPSRDGVMISASEPGILDKQGFGFIKTAKAKGKKLGMEAWADVARLEALGEAALLADLRAGRPVEVSVGAGVQTRKESGTHNGRAYKARWATMNGDHLAMLPGGRGACSIDMGCGAHRAASAGAPTYEIHGDDIHTVTEGGRMAADKGLKPKSLRERLTAMATAFRAMAPFDTPEEAASEEAAELVGYKSLRVMLDSMGDAWDEASGIVDDLIADEEDDPTETPSQEAAEEEVEGARLDALCALIGAIVSSGYAAQGVAYRLNAPDAPEPADPRYMEARAENFRAAIGKTISAKNMKTVQAAHDGAHAMHDHTMALGAACDVTKTLSAGDTTGGTPAKETSMDKKDTIKALTACPCSGFTAGDEKFLESLPEARLTEMKTASDARKAEKDALVAAQSENTALKAAAAKPADASALTEEQVLAKFPSIRALVDRATAQDQGRKDELVGALKACQDAYSDDELKALGLPELERLAKIAKVGDEPTAHYGGARVKAAAAGDKDVYANPPNGYEGALKAAAAKKQ